MYIIVYEVLPIFGRWVHLSKNLASDIWPTMYPKLQLKLQNLFEPTDMRGRAVWELAWLLHPTRTMHAKFSLLYNVACAAPVTYSIRCVYVQVGSTAAGTSSFPCKLPQQCRESWGPRHLIEILPVTVTFLFVKEKNAEYGRECHHPIFLYLLLLLPFFCELLLLLLSP